MDRLLWKKSKNTFSTEKIANKPIIRFYNKLYYNTLKLNFCRSLVDVVYSLKDEVQELKQVRVDLTFCPFSLWYDDR